MSSLTRNPNNLLPQNPTPKAAAPTNSKQITYDEVSKHFSSPLADAAESLGVCASVLKKVCHENGLARWPYRKYLLGKSIEQIKKDAARDMAKRQREVVKIAGSVSDNSVPSTVVSFLSPQPQQRTTSSLDVSQSHPVMQPQGNKNVQVQVRSPPIILYTATYTRGTEDDEFIYGFPSEGLSTVSNRWWGKSSSSGNTNNVMDSTSGSTVSPEIGPLTSLRKRAAEEGLEALKLGVHSRYATKKLDSTKEMLLQQIFKSLAPAQKSDEPV